jgi:hypothetical protein
MPAIVILVFGEDSPGVSLMHDEDVAQDLAPEGADPPFGAVRASGAPEVR